MISPNQPAFLDGRQITEASLLANEVMDSRRVVGRNGIVFQLDLEKALDSVNWNYILMMLGKFSFPVKMEKFQRSYL